MIIQLIISSMVLVLLALPPLEEVGGNSKSCVSERRD